MIRTLSSAGAGVCAIALLLGAAPPARTNANALAPRRSASHGPRVAAATPAPCTTNYPGASFSGLTEEYDIAGGDDSAVLGGDASAACAIDSGIGSGYQNSVAFGNGASAAFVGAGDGNAASGSDAFIGAGASNVAQGVQSFVGAGQSSMASGENALVGAGSTNTASGAESFVGSGQNNHGGGQFAFVGSGTNNSAQSDGSAVGAGTGNYASGSDAFAGSGIGNVAGDTNTFDGGGYGNYMTGTDSTIEGGYDDTVNGIYATVAGGEYESADAGFSTAAGGAHDTASGTLSFVAGYQAQATQNGSFVWSDYVSGSAPLKDTAANQWVVRATGGTFFYSSEKAPYSGVELTSGSGIWASLSDRTAKDGIVSLDDSAVLAKISALPISTWRYKTESGVRHIGPMAQDFYGAFAVGEDARHIATIDEDGVALAAIRALDAEDGHVERDGAALRRTRSNLVMKAAIVESASRHIEAAQARLQVDARRADAALHREDDGIAQLQATFAMAARNEAALERRLGALVNPER